MDSINLGHSLQPTDPPKPPSGTSLLTKKQKILAFVRKNKRLLLIILAVLILCGGGWWWVAATKTPAVVVETPTPTPSPTPTPATMPSLLNGVVVATELYNRRPVAVMIENSPDARPQRGLAGADLVYEAMVEGSITRFMAVYSQSFPTNVGPVRSARSYYLDWLSEYDAIYAHAGGSPTALDRIRSYGIKDYPHNNDSYWREPKAGVASEHTLYADVSKIAGFAVSKKGWSTTSDYKPWLFKDPADVAAATGPITINYSGAQFKVDWTFSNATNEYSRSMAGAAHKDRDSGEQIKAKTVVVMTVQRAANAPYKDTKKESEWSMTTIGSGPVSVFFDGARIDGTWKKTSRTERTRFYDSADKEIELNRGKIWVQVIPPTSTVTVAAPPAV